MSVLVDKTSLERTQTTKSIDYDSMPVKSLNSFHKISQPFRFLDLPFELRSKILEMVLVSERVYCLDPRNFRAGYGRLNIFLTSLQMHEDAYRIFYGGHVFRIFPTHGRFFGNKIVPLIARLPRRYREALISLELRLGPGWNAPPLSWMVDGSLGLEQMIRVRVLKLFVECDPSLEAFQGFRVSKSFYTDFSQNLLEGILQRLPAISTVEIDGWPSVPRLGHLMKALIKTAKSAGVTVVVVSEKDLVEIQKDIHKSVPKLLPSINAGIPVR